MRSSCGPFDGVFSMLLHRVRSTVGTTSNHGVLIGHDMALFHSGLQCSDKGSKRSCVGLVSSSTTSLRVFTTSSPCHSSTADLSTPRASDELPCDAVAASQQTTRLPARIQPWTRLPARVRSCACFLAKKDRTSVKCVHVGVVAAVSGATARSNCSGPIRINGLRNPKPISRKPWHERHQLESVPTVVPPGNAEACSKPLRLAITGCVHLSNPHPAPSSQPGCQRPKINWDT